jgi:hypothetical protein
MEDRYATLGVTLKGVGALDTLAFVAGYHDYQAQRIDAAYGSENDLSLSAKYKRVNLMLKFADYTQGVLASARNTQKWWGQVEFVW